MIVEDEKLRHAILVAFGDKEVFKIIDSVMILPKSMADISKETAIPQTNVFRKIKWMLENRLVIIEKIDITEVGRKTSLFRSVWKTIGAKFEFGIVHVEVEQNLDQAGIITKKLVSIETMPEENSGVEEFSL